MDEPVDLTIRMNHIWNCEPMDGEWVIVCEHGEWCAGRAMSFGPDEDGLRIWRVMALNARQVPIDGLWGQLPPGQDIKATQQIVQLTREEMDKQIRKIEKTTKKAGKELKSLEKADKRRDKVCDIGEKAMKAKKAKKK